MIETIFLFLAKVVTVLVGIGLLIMPFYLLATFCHAIYMDLHSPNKADKTRANTSA